MPTLSTRLTLARSTRIGLPSGMSPRTVTENMAQESITTLPVQCTMVASGCLSISNCKTGVSSASIDASLQNTRKCTPAALAAQHYLGMEQRPCDATGDADQFGLAGEDLDEARTGHFWQVHSPAMANLRDVLVGGHNRRNLRQNPSRMDHELPDTALAGRLAYFLQRMALLDTELGYLRPAEAGQMSPDAQLLPQFVGQAADIGPRRHPAAKIDQAVAQAQDREFLHFHRDRLKLDMLLLTGQLVGRNAFDLLGGKRGWSLLEDANKPRRDGAKFFKCYIDYLRRSRRVAVAIVSVGRDPQPDCPLISLFRGQIKLAQAGEDPKS